MSIYNENIEYSFLETDESINNALNGLYENDIISCDINTTSQFFGDADITTISFATSKRQGIVFYFKPELVKQFLINYTGTIIWHNANYNLKVLVYKLFMDSYLDYKGMLQGIEVLTKSFEDTKIMSYLATNNCLGNNLDLEYQSKEYSKDSLKTEKNPIGLTLLRAMSIFYIYEKHKLTLDFEKQKDLYNGLFKESIIQILQMELVGMPIHMPSVKKANKRLNRMHIVYTKFLNDKLKTIGYQTINPNSSLQLQDLLYGYCQLPIIDRTNKGNPSVNCDALEKLQYHCKTKNIKMILRCLIHILRINNTLSSFIPNLLNATKLEDGSYRLYGNFNLGGTVSGRMSSSNPNLQGLPSSSEYSKLIKDCFRSIKGKLYAGADFNSLESVVNALITKDKNKLKELIGGFDSHCYKMVRYWPERFTHIDINDVNQVNNTKYTHSDLRNDSKPVSFALQYFGEPITLQRNCGFSEQEAVSIYNNYHSLYFESDKWVKNELNKARRESFSSLAFGLRLRTPYMNGKAERTVGNAVSGQSYGLLNNRAANEFRKRVLNSKYKYDIQIVALIHDAIYLEFKSDIEIAKWVNDNLIECMKWNELPELQHDIVKLSAELDIFYPSWSNPITIKNNMNSDEIKQTVINNIRKNNE